MFSYAIRHLNGRSLGNIQACRHRYHYSTSRLLANIHGSDSSVIDTNPNNAPAFQKILVANRGEIARRIIRTCKKESIKTVAIYSTTDSKSPHVKEADEAICVGPAASSASYLNIDNICKAIEMSGAEAVHPGYGFLSENAEFARRVEETTAEATGKGVKFIGPSPSAIIAMGDKITSKKIAKESGVNIIPGYDGFVTSQDHAVTIANEIGYPVMIKATSGGGGKGMRICYNDAQVREGFLLSTAEAKSFFNDEHLFIEKFIEKPHHIEIQLLAGRKEVGGELEILCFPERDCSIQRRNQKVIEESPSSLLKEETRAEMVRQVKRLVRKVNYTSAGTVEFLVDKDQNFFFLEMNTRLQVEHPVTEMVSGDIDLVHGMISVAAGNGIPSSFMEKLGDQSGLSLEQKEGLSVPHHGYAIEARIYAEDPVRGFLPSTGPLLEYIEPAQTIDGNNSCKVRVDSGVVSGSIISQFYDPMISKLIVHSPHSRKNAIHALQKALDSYVISGVGHNSSFLLDVLRQDSFIAGDTPTNFIQLHYPDGFSGVSLSIREKSELAAIACVAGKMRGVALDRPPLPCLPESGVESSTLVVCLGGLFGTPFLVQCCAEKIHVSEMSEDGDREPRTFLLDRIEFESNARVISVRVNGEDRFIQFKSEDSTGSFLIRSKGADFNVIIMSPEEYKLSRHMHEPHQVDNTHLILSPMPGTLISYSVNDGDSVVDGQDICIVEAMKMQNIIRSPRSGVIKKCHAAVGLSLMTDEVIVEYE
mmetsp:Transcript_15423/g.29087  ORF Transcript_15423/g.29087 Transcript_15423/m.29087 type:complete len:761 (+) Transcript_15423:1774-4056(+)